MGLIDRVNRIVKAEINYSRGKTSTGSFEEGAALVGIGTAAGVSVGKAGILAGGTGFGLGAVPLAAIGALTGAALYEAIKILVEGDSSSVGAAVAGAATGAGVSAAVGGVGIAVGGTAFGMGMAPMAAAGAVAGLGIAGLNRLLEQGIDPEKLLDLAIEDMQEELVRFRQAVIPVMAAQKRFQQQYEQAETDVNKWHNRAQLAVEKGDDYLAREALIQKKNHRKNAETIKAHIEQQKTQLDTFKQNLVAIERKVSEAKAFKARLKRLAASIKANSHLQNTIGNLSTSTTMGAFERMEEKVRMMEAKSQLAAELAGADLEEQFRLLASGSSVDEELAAMKAQILGDTPLPVAVNPTTSFQPVTPVDAELEELRRQINQY